jgi:hypothetical protein
MNRAANSGRKKGAEPRAEPRRDMGRLQDIPPLLSSLCPGLRACADRRHSIGHLGRTKGTHKSDLSQIGPIRRGCAGVPPSTGLKTSGTTTVAAFGHRSSMGERTALLRGGRCSVHRRPTAGLRRCRYRRTTVLPTLARSTTGRLRCLKLHNRCRRNPPLRPIRRAPHIVGSRSVVPRDNAQLIIQRQRPQFNARCKRRRRGRLRPSGPIGG